MVFVAGTVCGNQITEPRVAPAMECATSRGRQTMPARLGKTADRQSICVLRRPAVLVPHQEGVIIARFQLRLRELNPN